MSKIEIEADKGSIAAGMINESFILMINQEGNSLNQEEAQELEKQYLSWVIQQCAGLEWLDQVRQQDEQSPEISLDSVYTALFTTSSKQPQHEAGELRKKVQTYSAVEMLNRESRLVITGAPGSGKSALVNFLAICMAGELLQLTQRNLRKLTQPLPDEDGEDQAEKQAWEHGGLIPVRVILRDFAKSDDFPANGKVGESKHLMGFIQSQLEKSSIDYFSLLKVRLRRGEVLFMLDGLDEVPQSGKIRERMLACIQAFYRSHENVRFLVTARPYAYGQGLWKLRDFQNTALAEFTRGQIIRFVDRWYNQCAGIDDAVTLQRAEKLKRAIFRNSTLQELAQRPLLLTLIAYLHSNRYDLPEYRAELYERLLELLIEKWEKARFKVSDAEEAYQCEQYSLAEFLKVDVDAIRLVLERLAFDAHASQSELSGTADIAAEKLSHQLFCLATGGEQKPGSSLDPVAISEYLCERVGILYQRGGESDLNAVYTFPHRSFQEYLAAAYFRREEKTMFDRFNNADSDDWWELAAYLGKTDPDRWREVVTLAGGIRSRQEPGQVWSLLDALVPTSELNENLKVETAWGVRLAGEILAENLKREELKNKHRKILARIQSALPHLLRVSTLNATERVAAGTYLGKIGDPRAEIQIVNNMQFCPVPAGDFFLGSTKSDSQARDDEMQGAGIKTISETYAIARYPVTVAQFRQFVDETDYHSEHLERSRGQENTPIVYVSWFDAMAFCNWLTARWQKATWLPKDWRVTLPSEPEWEKAARGGLKIPKAMQDFITAKELKERLAVIAELNGNPQPQRVHPWGVDWDDEKLNADMNIGTVSAVGCYPQGSSPYGCEEMCGNVWEWTRSLYETAYPKTEALWASRHVRDDAGRYVLRGGAFFNYLFSVRCAARSHFDPDSRNYYVGFRVVLSPLL